MATENYKHRRYVGGKESLSYVLFDSSKSFHIDEFKTRFVVDVLKIDLGWNTVIDMINGIWDIINDGLLGALIDKTKTRWGKFRPYLLAHSTIGTFFLALYWLAPLFLGKDPRSLAKAAVWLLLTMTFETFSTVKDIGETGMVSCMSPNPSDKVRLYTLAEVISSIWESLPSLIMGALIDLVNHNKVGFSMDAVYMSMGAFTVIAGGGLVLAFALLARERVSQAVEHYKFSEGLRAIMRNKPLLLLLISEFFGGFKVETWEHNYYIDVLGGASLRNLVRLPGAPLSFLSYTYINKVRERYPIKSLWIFGKHLQDACSLVVFAIGSVGGLYRKVVPMVALLMIRNLFYMGTLSVNKIIPKEIVLDSLDYAEWNTGFRSEGTILAAKSMVGKITRNVLNSMTTLIMKMTGYSLEAGFGQQSAKAQYALFAMSFGLPALMGAFALIPKLFYDLTGAKRAKMFEELTEMRKRRQAEYDTLEA